MAGLGHPGRAMPRTKAGDYERCLELLATFGADTATRAYVVELRDAALVHDAAREAADAATAEAGRREAAALEAEEAAWSDLAELAAHKVAYDARTRSERTELDAERRRLDELAKKLDDEGADLNQREAAIKRAFDAYTGD